MDAVVYYLDPNEWRFMRTHDQRKVGPREETEADHIWNDAAKVAQRIRRPVTVYSPDGSRCYFAIDAEGNPMARAGLINQAGDEDAQRAAEQAQRTAKRRREDAFREAYNALHYHPRNIDHAASIIEDYEPALAMEMFKGDREHAKRMLKEASERRSTANDNSTHKDQAGDEKDQARKARNEAMQADALRQMTADTEPEAPTGDAAKDRRRAIELAAEAIDANELQALTEAVRFIQRLDPLDADLVPLANAMKRRDMRAAAQAMNTARRADSAKAMNARHDEKAMLPSNITEDLQRMFDEAKAADLLKQYAPDASHLRTHHSGDRFLDHIEHELTLFVAAHKPTGKAREALREVSEKIDSLRAKIRKARK